MPAAFMNITIEVGTTFELSFVWTGASTPINLGVYGARFNLRSTKYATPIFTASTENGLAASTPVNGSLYFMLTSVQTAQISFSKGYYEVEIYTSTATPYVRRLLKGQALIDRT